MNQFVKFGNRLTVPPPIVCEDAVLYELHLKANLDKLSALCDAVFGSSPVRCIPLGDYVLVRFGSIKWVGPEKLGSVSAGVEENQIIFQIPIDVSIQQSQHICAYFSPFIWVNNLLSLVGGREVFGYPKSLGEIDIKHGPAPSLTLSTYTGKRADNILKETVLIQISYTAKPPTEVDLADTYQTWFDGRVIQGNSATEIFFKQFHAIDSNAAYDSACFQQIAIADYYTDLKCSELTGSFSLNIKDDGAISPLLEDLGIDPDSKGLKGWKFNGSFAIDHPKVLWQMPVPAVLPGGNLSRPAGNVLIQRSARKTLIQQ